ncbi:deoxyuridine 5'-triphosphate nucleotidohydrolase [Tissierella praeacuta]|uniref:dUTP diphosphatase n=1 Tax=Tissierella praeacuta TaxID=43131 RepID=UPI0010D9D904|nr:dUTP diphosphatase [Tissierella praeacuta]TCU72887.1 deoxyuridine 5'-triphosphate nucleotidohydrolase [Tissierella praeacuta]
MNNKPIMKVVCKGEKPSYANQFAAGLDIRANNDEPITINVGEYADIPTKLSMEIPNGFCGIVIPRSDLGFNHRITLINDIGLIDEDYRGDIGVRLLNEGTEPYTIYLGDRVAQMVIIPYVQPELVFVDELSETQRGKGGFGSTGV